MVATPADTPKIAPVAELTEATLVLELVHVPLVAVVESVVEAPTHTRVAPDMVPPDDGAAITVIVVVAVPEAPAAYDITEVPGLSPVTWPLLSILAMEVDALLQVPPEVALASVIVAPTHTLDGPVMAATVVADDSVMVTFIWFHLSPLVPASLLIALSAA